MLVVKSLFWVGALLILFLKIISIFLSSFFNKNREEFSSYECGFEYQSLSRLPFSLQYFFLTLIFLLFDLEIVLLVFLPGLLLSGSVFYMVLFIIIFLLVLVFSLLYEWKMGALNWLQS